MSAAAGLSLARGFVIAGILSPQSFASYAVTVSLGAFLSSILSWGLVEETIKQFPRIAVSGDLSSLTVLSKRAVRRLTSRAAIYIPVAALAAYFLGPSSFVTLGFAVPIAYGVVVTGIVASMQRALLDPMHLAFGTVVRSAIALILASLGAYQFGLVGAVAAEVIAALVGSFVSALTSHRKIAKQSLNKPGSSAAHDGDVPSRLVEAHGGVQVFVAYTALSVPVYLDRTFVSAVFSQSEAASYALMALFVSASIVLVNIVAQKVGPQIVSREHAGAAPGSLVWYAAKWSGLVLAIWLSFIGVASCLPSIAPFSEMFARYSVSGELLFAIALLGCVQVTALFEFILIARDREKQFVFLAITYLASVLVVGTVVAYAAVPLLGLIGLLIVARLLYLTLIVFALCRRTVS